jgi:hypothetical protein
MQKGSKKWISSRGADRLGGRDVENCPSIYLAPQSELNRALIRCLALKKIDHFISEVDTAVARKRLGAH